MDHQLLRQKPLHLKIFPIIIEDLPRVTREPRKTLAMYIGFSLQYL